MYRHFVLLANRAVSIALASSVICIQDFSIIFLIIAENKLFGRHKFVMLCKRTTCLRFLKPKCDLEE